MQSIKRRIITIIIIISNNIWTHLYTRPTGVIVKIKLMRVVGKYIEPTDFALQRWSLRIPYGVPSITKFHSLQSIIIFQQRVHKESLSFRKNERFFFFSRFKLKISFFFLSFFFCAHSPYTRHPMGTKSKGAHQK